MRKVIGGMVYDMERAELLEDFRFSLSGVNTPLVKQKRFLGKYYAVI